MVEEEGKNLARASTFFLNTCSLFTKIVCVVSSTFFFFFSLSNV